MTAQRGAGREGRGARGGFPDVPAGSAGWGERGLSFTGNVTNRNRAGKHRPVREAGCVLTRPWPHGSICPGSPGESCVHPRRRSRGSSGLWGHGGERRPGRRSSRGYGPPADRATKRLSLAHLVGHTNVSRTSPTPFILAILPGFCSFLAGGRCGAGVRGETSWAPIRVVRKTGHGGRRGRKRSPRRLTRAPCGNRTHFAERTWLRHRMGQSAPLPRVIQSTLWEPRHDRPTGGDRFHVPVLMPVRPSFPRAPSCCKTALHAASFASSRSRASANRRNDRAGTRIHSTTPRIAVFRKEP